MADLILLDAVLDLLKDGGPFSDLIVVSPPEEFSKTGHISTSTYTIDFRVLWDTNAKDPEFDMFDVTISVESYGYYQVLLKTDSGQVNLDDGYVDLDVIGRPQVVFQATEIVGSVKTLVEDTVTLYRLYRRLSSLGTCYFKNAYISEASVLAKGGPVSDAVYRVVYGTVFVRPNNGTRLGVHLWEHVYNFFGAEGLHFVIEGTGGSIPNPRAFTDTFYKAEAVASCLIDEAKRLTDGNVHAVVYPFWNGNSVGTGEMYASINLYVGMGDGVLVSDHFEEQIAKYHNKPSQGRSDISDLWGVNWQIRVMESW